MPTAKLGHIDLWYQVTGSGEPVVLTGGFGILHEQFHLATPILEKQFTVLNWNWRGAGFSDRAMAGDDYNVEAWTSDLLAILDDAGFDKVHLWSTSTGSLVGIHFAARYADRVKSLTTYPYFKTPSDLRKVYVAYQVIFDAFGWDGITRILSWIGSPSERLDSPEGIAFAKWEGEVLKRSLNDEAFNRICQAYEYVDLTADLSRLGDIPVCLLLGEEGPLGLKTPMLGDLLNQFTAAVPKADVRTIAGAGGTYCMMEKPEETTQAFISFIESLSS